MRSLLARGGSSWRRCCGAAGATSACCVALTYPTLASWRSTPGAAISCCRRTARPALAFSRS
jgi:hypothetical protein